METKLESIKNCKKKRIEQKVWLDCSKILCTQTITYLITTVMNKNKINKKYVDEMVLAKLKLKKRKCKIMCCFR